MKKILLILLLLAGCSGAREVAAVHPRLTCEGKFVEQSDYLLIMQCNDGKIVTFQSYRTSLGKTIVDTKQ